MRLSVVLLIKVDHNAKGGEADMIGEFGYKDGTLCCSGVPIPKILAAVPHERGVTPAYIYSKRGLLGNCHAMMSAFPKADIHFAVKACMNINILRELAKLGIGFDVVSHGELGRVRQANATGDRIVYAGAAKTDWEIAGAVGIGATIVVERPEELPIISVAANAQDLPTNILLRLRPNVDAHTHQHLTTGKAFSKFGMPEAMVREILRDWNDPLVYIRGIHHHIGSQIDNPAPTVQAMNVALPIIDEFDLDILDIGGGFPVWYEAEGSAPPINDFADAVHSALGNRDLQLIIEPGRSLVADTGILVATVMSEEYGESEFQAEEYVIGLPRMEMKEWRIVTCDTGMADLIRPMLYGAVHQIWPVREDGTPVSIPTSVAGPYCESTDFLARGLLNLPELRRGDLLAVMHTGAYGRAMASNYNGNLIGPEVMVEPDGQITVIAERQSFGHSIALETG